MSGIIRKCTGSQLVALLALSSLCLMIQAVRAQEDKVDGTYDELSREQLKEVAKLQGSFQEIEIILGQEKNNFSPESGMQTVRALQQKKDWTFAMFNGKLKEAMRIFTSLADVTRKDFCNYGGYEILAKNFVLNPTSGHLTYATSILYHYARQHAIICLPIYRGKYLFERNGVAILPMVKKLNKYFNGLELADFTPVDLFESDEEGEDGQQQSEQQQQLRIPFVEANLDTFDIRVTGLVKILTNMDFDLGESASIQAGLVRKAVEGNLLEACGAFVDMMKGIFAPAKIDLFMFHSGKQVPVPQFDEAFLNGWRNYRICLYFDRADRKDMVSRFLKATEFDDQS